MPEAHTEPHRRYNPLNGEWVLISPQRTARPWQGQIEEAHRDKSVPYDPNCYLCPGNSRAGGAHNPNYSETFVFDNDFPALTPNPARAGEEDKSPLLLAETERGICRVACFTPRHDLTLATMSVQQIRKVIDLWAAQYAELEAKKWIRYTQVFENRGSMMGASNPHPHCQIWATSHVPNEPGKELACQKSHLDSTGGCLLCSYGETELHERTRVVLANSEFLAVVPFWAVWPYEILLVSRRHRSAMGALSENERQALAEALNRIAIRYDNLFRTPFPYSMGFHPAPSDGSEHPEWHFHAHFYPPLLRSATVRKFMVGYEMLGMPQRDITPESAAEQLRSLPEVHYTLQGAA